MHQKKQRVWELLLVFLKIGAFTFGGGYAMIPLIQREMVDNKKWISEKDILDIVAISESTPGPIAVNAATFVGYHVAGVARQLVWCCRRFALSLVWRQFCRN